MKNEIKRLLEYIKRINVNILSSSLAFYALIIITPFINVINGIMGELNISTYQTYAYSNTLSIISIIFIVVNSIWVSSKLINISLIISDIIYVDIPKRSSFKLRIKSFILMFLLVWMIIIELIALLLLVRIFNYFPSLKSYYFYMWIQYLIQFSSIVLIIGFIYKYIIPTYVSFRITVLSSLLVSLIWFIFSHLYQLLCKYLNLWQNEYVYGQMTTYLITIMWIYFVCIVFVYGLIFTFYLTKMIKNKKKGNTIDEQERSNGY